MSDIQTALDLIRAKLPDCQRFIDYYDGNHKMTFASDKFKTTFGQTLKGMRDNLCPIVVDAPVDRMEVLNFSGDNENATIAGAAWAIWQRETLELVSSEVHTEAVKCGEGYLIVWADEDNVARFYAQDPRQCVVVEDEGTGKPLFAAKQWLTSDKYVRLTLYYPDRILKYITRKKYNGTDQTQIKESSFVPLDLHGEEAETPNAYGVIPMFKFETQPVLTNAIPMQDALNKTVADRLVSQEFGAFRQRWATGLTPPTNELTGIPTLPFKAGVDRLWFTNDAQVKFGEFDATDIEPYLKAADSDRLEMARVTGTPLHFFSINTSDAISGEALKTLESRFTKRVHRLTLNFGTVWAKVMQFALQIEGNASAQNLTVQWQSPEQRSEKELCDTLVVKQTLGVPDEVLWEELGYTEEDITKFEKLKAAAVKQAQQTMPPANPPQETGAVM
jgi:hypothetical protein